MKYKRKVVAVVTAAGLLAGLTGVAAADNVTVAASDVTVGGSDVYSAPVGVAVDVPIFIDLNSAGGNSGCDASDGSPVTLSYASVVLPTGVSVSPVSQTFSACGSQNAKTFAFTSVTTGDKTIPPVGVSDTAGTYNANTSRFTLRAGTPADTTPPQISYVVNPTAANGADGWYKTGNVSLTWTVAEPQSPGSLAKTGCVDQIISADQAATTYSCLATSTGGAAGAVSVTIKRDVTLPTVALVGGPANGATYYEGEPIPAAPTCTASDATSGLNGLCSVSGYATSVGTHIVSAFATDSAGNAGTSAPVSYTVLDDGTPPAIGADLNPDDPDGLNGWYKSNVVLTWTVSEAQTPASVATSGCVNQNIVADQAAQSYSCSASSLGGAEGPVTVSVKRDGTPPTVTLNGAGLAGSHYEGEVPSAPTCSASDLMSGVNGRCAVTGYGTAIDTHTVKATAVDHAGNESESASVVYTVLDDTSAPVITKSLTPAVPSGDNGWYKGNVAIDWTVTEPETPGSLSVTGCQDVTVSADQAATLYTCGATSLGGSAAGDSVTIQRDATPPTVDLDASGLAGSHYEGEVPAAPTCSASDDLSLVQGSCSVSGYGTAMGPHTVMATATDHAGNVGESSTVSYTVLDDTSAPAISKVVTPSVPDGSNGWYRSNVTIDWTVAEAETPSSLRPAGGCDDVSITADQVETPHSCSASSLGGNASDSVNVKRDATEPTVVITSASSTMSPSISVSGDQADTTSGVGGVEVNGLTASLSNAAFEARAVPLACGSNTVTAVATDRAGNRSSDSMSVYRQCFTGAFQQPLDPGGVLNKAKLGRVVPVKLTIAANSGSTPNPVYYGVRSTPCTTGAVEDVVETYAAGASNTGNTFRPADGAWIYNLDTAKLPGATVGSCYQLDVFVGGTVNSSGIASGGVPVQNGSVRIHLTR